MFLFDAPRATIRGSFLRLSLAIVVGMLPACMFGQAPPTCPPATGTSFANQTLIDKNFHAYPPGSLVGADFSNAILNGATFAGQDLTNARFQGAN